MIEPDTLRLELLAWPSVELVDDNVPVVVVPVMFADAARIISARRSRVVCELLWAELRVLCPVTVSEFNVAELPVKLPPLKLVYVAVVPERLPMEPEP